MTERLVTQFRLVGNAKFFIGKKLEVRLHLEAEVSLRPQTDANAGSRWLTQVGLLESEISA